LLFTNFERTILKDQPHKYWCQCVEHKTAEQTLKLPHMVTDGRILFVSNPILIWSSLPQGPMVGAKGLQFLNLRCLACFLNVVRTRLGINSMVLNNQFPCNVAPWRTPCATTAIFRDSSHGFYLEGCEIPGVFFRPFAERPDTPPPYLVCGGSPFDCQEGLCPNNWSFFGEEPFTNCQGGNQIGLNVKSYTCKVRLSLQGAPDSYYAGISPEGYDFTINPDIGVQLTYQDARTMARAIADSYLDWSAGMLSSRPDGRVAIVSNDNKVLTEWAHPWPQG
jgi:hypothetical protein